jgi:hypothetical protein
VTADSPGNELLGRLPATTPLHRPIGSLIRRARSPEAVSGALVVLSVILWAVGLGLTDMGRMTDLGLISVLPPPTIASILLLVGVAVAELRREAPSSRVLASTLVVLVVVLYAIPVILEPVVRMAVTYVHDGFVEYIRRTGTVAPALEARFDWPGFFILAAFLTQTAGLPDSMPLAAWAPVYFNLMYLAPLALIFRSMTADVRLVWAALFGFILTNWIGQDYFSPQALNYFLYLTIIAVFLVWFRSTRPRSDRIAGWLAGRGAAGRLLGRLYDLATPEQSPADPLAPWQQAAIIVSVVVIFAFVAYSHQLTPFFTVAALLGVAAFNRIVLRSLPILLGVMAVAWVSYMTVPFLQGHVVSLLKEVGQLGDTVGSNVTNRLAGSVDHQLVVTVRLIFTLGLWGLAALGAVVRYRDGRRDLTLVILAVAPLPLVAAQAYGGELVLRLYLFTLPFVVFLVAGLVYGRPVAPPSLPRSVLAFACIAAIGFIFLLTRYGNERTDAFTTAEVQSVRELYAMAPPGSLLVAAANDLPWKFRDVEQYDYVPVTDEALVGDITAISDVMSNPRYPATFLILTRSQGNYSEAFNGLPPGAWDTFVAQVTESPKFRLVYQNADAEIYVPAGQAIPQRAP